MSEECQKNEGTRGPGTGQSVELGEKTGGIERGKYRRKRKHVGTGVQVRRKMQKKEPKLQIGGISGRRYNRRNGSSSSGTERGSTDGEVKAWAAQCRPRNSGRLVHKGPQVRPGGGARLIATKSTQCRGTRRSATWSSGLQGIRIWGQVLVLG